MKIEERLNRLMYGVSPWGKNYYTVQGRQGGPTPYVVASIASQDPIASHDHPLAATRCWRTQFSCWSPVFGEVRDSADAIKLKLVGFHEPSPGIKTALLVDERDAYDEATKCYGKHVDIEIYEDLI